MQYPYESSQLHQTLFNHSSVGLNLAEVYYMIVGKRRCQFLCFSINTFSAQQQPWASAPWFTYIRSHSCGKVHLRKRSFSFSETFSECLACDSKILDYMAGRVCVTINEGSETQHLHRGRTTYVAQRTWFVTNQQKCDWVSAVVLDLLYLNANQSVSARFRPLSTQLLYALELRGLNPVDYLLVSI